jgi:N6-adenosine-specific RNA methylase IME4
MTFNLIMICPPWKHFNRFRTRSMILPDNIPPKLNRSIMAFEFIQQILRNFTRGDHLVFVWVPGKFTSDYREYMVRQGYTSHGSFMWIRPKWKMGSDKKTVEFLLVFHKGNMPKLSDHYIKMADSHFSGTVKSRSEKPESAYELLEEEFPMASKLQVYGYTNRPGWTVFHQNDDKIK